MSAHLLQNVWWVLIGKNVAIIKFVLKNNRIGWSKLFIYVLVILDNVSIYNILKNNVFDFLVYVAILQKPLKIS